MKKTSTYLVTALILLSISYCCVTNKDPEKIVVDFYSFFSEEVDHICFSDLELNNNSWEYVYLVSPYAEIDSISINLSKKSSKKFRKLAMSDGTYSALFYNEKRDLLFYTLIPANIINLTAIANKAYPKKKVFSIVKEGDHRKVQD